MNLMRKPLPGYYRFSSNRSRVSETKHATHLRIFQIREVYNNLYGALSKGSGALVANGDMMTLTSHLPIAAARLFTSALNLPPSFAPFGALAPRRVCLSCSLASQAGVEITSCVHSLWAAGRVRVAASSHDPVSCELEERPLVAQPARPNRPRGVGRGCARPSEPGRRPP